MFWNLTPWQTRVCLKAYVEKERNMHNERVWIMWHGAALGRSGKRLPDLKKFMIKSDDDVEPEQKKDGPRLNEGAILAWLQTVDVQNKRKKEKS